MPHSSLAGLLLAAALLLPTAAGAAPNPPPGAERQPLGPVADDGQAELVTLTNDAGMVVRISSRGGTITEIMAPDRDGTPGNVVLASAGNSIIGRFANRIGGGGFTLDGTRYDLPGANPQTGVTLHAGRPSFGGRLFRTELPDAGDARARFTYVSPDGENGFPGEVTLTVTYSLTPDNVLRLEYQATTTKPTVVNFTNHAYFTLGTHASGPVYDQLLQVFASRWTPSDANQVPTGEIAPVAGTPFDFRQPARIGERVYSSHPQMLVGRGLDHNFVLDGPSGAEPRPAAILFDPDTGRRLEVRTTEPGMQIYTANGMSGNAVDTDGLTLRQGDGIAFETQHFPDSPNHPDFPTTVLRPGETFRSVTEFAFTTDAWEQPD